MGSNKGNDPAKFIRDSVRAEPVEVVANRVRSCKITLTPSYDNLHAVNIMFIIDA